MRNHTGGMDVRKAWLLAWCLAYSSLAAAQETAWPSQPAASAAALEAQVPDLARRLLAEGGDLEPVQRMRLQLTADRYREATESIRAAREQRASTAPADAKTLFLQYEIYADAKLRGEPTTLPALRRGFAALDDRDAARALPVFSVNLPRARGDLDAALARQFGKKNIARTEALELVRVFLFHKVYAALLPDMPALIAEDEARRYEVQRDLVVPGADGASLRGLVVRPKSAHGAQPALLGFTIYVNDDWSLSDAKAAAAHGYVGVVVYSRGKAGSPGPIAPYEHDGADAAAAIAWIARQPWCDGRVGMYGNSYNSFTQWAAAKHRPPALKAMMTSASTAPGIDVPMQGNVFLNFLYPWPLWTANNATLDGDSYGDQARWQRLDRTWYESGRAYRDLPKIDGSPNPVYSRWLQHPGYDAYWQAMTPQGDEFARIDIPVLAVTGYFDGGRVGVQHYYDEHLRHRPNADHTLLIGPWGHFAMQRGVAPFVEGYQVDPSALIDLPELRYQWFDHVFRGAPKPEPLRGRVNYQVMGADAWKHAPSIDAMANERLRLYLQPASGDGDGALAEKAPSRDAFSAQNIDFADRSDVDWTSPADSLLDKLDPHGGLVFASEPFASPVELSGLLSGRLDFLTNKRDMDLTVALYERMADGRYLLLAWHMGRASYAKDREHRELLKPGKRQALDFRSERLVSRRLQTGSRLLIVLGVNKQRDIQINYGSGKDVSDETLADADEPMRLRWYGNSYVELPLMR